MKYNTLQNWANNNFISYYNKSLMVKHQQYKIILHCSPIKIITYMTFEVIKVKNNKFKINNDL